MIWDTAGQERFRTIISSYYRGAHAVAIVYDVTNEQSFLNVETWVNEIKKNISEDIPIILIGNKMDSKRIVPNSEAKDYADKNEFIYIETSAKDNTNINDIFTSLIDVLINKSQSLSQTFYNTTKSLYKSLIKDDDNKSLERNDTDSCNC